MHGRRAYVAARPRGMNGSRAPCCRFPRRQISHRRGVARSRQPRGLTRGASDNAVAYLRRALQPHAADGPICCSAGSAEGLVNGDAAVEHSGGARADRRPDPACRRLSCLAASFSSFLSAKIFIPSSRTRWIRFPAPTPSSTACSRRGSLPTPSTCRTAYRRLSGGWSASAAGPGTPPWAETCCTTTPLRECRAESRTMAVPARAGRFAQGTLMQNRNLRLSRTSSPHESVGDGGSR